MKIEPVKITRQYLGLLGNRLLVNTETLEDMRRQASKGLTVSAPLELQEGSTGRHLALPVRGGFWAVLSGASTPYTYQEQRLVDGVWQDGTREGDTAHEVNGVDGLAGNRVWLEPGGPGDYRFQWVAGVGSGVCTNVVLSGKVTGCLCEIPDAIVSLYHEDGTLVSTKTTGLDGLAEWTTASDGLVAGPHYFVASAPLYSEYTSGVFRLSCGLNRPYDFLGLGLLVDLQPATGYRCSSCYRGIPEPTFLTFNGTPISSDLPSHWGYSETFPFAGVCGLFVPGGSYGFFIPQTEGNVIFELGCQSLSVSTSVCVQIGTQDRVPEGVPRPDPVYFWRHVWILYGSLPNTIDLTQPISLTANFPEDFGITLPFEYTGRGGGASYDWVYKCDEWSGPLAITIEEPSPPAKPSTLPGTATTAEFCATVKTLACSGVGSPIPGASVTVEDHDGNNVGAGTTDDDGKFCLTVPLPGSYNVTAEYNGCTNSRFFGLGKGCLSNAFFAGEVPLCCTSVCVVVRDVATLDPIEGAEVWIATQTTGPLLTDAEGKVCFELSTQEILGLGGCPSVIVRVFASNYLTLCRNVPLVCNGTTPDYELLLYPISGTDPLSGEPWSYVYTPHCTDLGCTVSGVIDRGLIPEKIHVAMSCEATQEDGIWYSVLGGLIDGVVLVFELDPVLFSGDENPGAAALTDSPFGYDPADGSVIEYYWEGPCDFAPLGAGCPHPFSWARAWFRSGVGLIVKLYYQQDVEASVNCTSGLIPGSSAGVICATCNVLGTEYPNTLEIHMFPGYSDAFDFCLPVDFSYGNSFIEGGAGPYALRFNVEVTE
jgi:hypothetical protein